MALKDYLGKKQLSGKAHISPTWIIRKKFCNNFRGLELKKK